jgi:hypothetical protein
LIQKNSKKKKKKKGRVHIPIAKTTQGRELVNMALFLRNDLGEEYIIGFPAFRKIANSFGFSKIGEITPHKNYLKREEHKKKLSQRAEKEFAQTVKQIREDPNKIHSIQSIRERREVQQLLDLDAQKENAIIYINNLLLAQRNTSESYTYLFSLRGGLFNQLQQQKESLPQTLRTYLEELRSKDIELPSNEFIYKTNVLRAYANLHQPIETKIIIGDFIEDMNYLQQMSQENIFKKTITTQTLTDITDLLSSQTTTLANAGRILQKNKYSKSENTNNKNISQ